jgi:hypothetical protein
MAGRSASLMLLATVALAACDTFHGLESRAELAVPADLDCIDRVLRESPAVGEVMRYRTALRAFEVAPRWGSRLAINSYWGYRAGGQAIILQVIDEEGRFHYSNGLVRDSARVAPETAAAIEPLIAQLDAAIVAQCGLPVAAAPAILRF